MTVSKPLTPASEPGRVEHAVVGSIVRRVFFRGRRGGPWSPPPEAVQIQIPGPSGARLAALRRPVPGARGIAVLVHPDRRYGKQWFVREGWLDFLAAAGIESLAFDLPMYGASRGGSPYLHEHVAAAFHEAQRLRPGLPVHIIGLSIGAFASINAACKLDGVASLVLESPYPTFDAWYGENGHRGPHLTLDKALRRVFPKTYRRIDAGANVADLKVPNILIAAATDDPVTPMTLTWKVARNAPPEARYLEFPRRDHLGLFSEPGFRAAVLETLGVAGGSPKAMHQAPRSGARALAAEPDGLVPA